MTPAESAALVAERLPRALAKAAGVKWWTLDTFQKAEMAAEAMALLHEFVNVGLVVLPKEVFPGEKAEVSKQSQNGQGVRVVPSGGGTEEPVDLEADDSGVRAPGDGSQAGVSASRAESVPLPESRGLFIVGPNGKGARGEA